MPIFRRSRSIQDATSGRADLDSFGVSAEETRAALEAGTLPPSAVLRLKSVGDRDGAAYTSDLSVNEFLLLRQAGLSPLTQVLGACVYQVGYYQFPGFGRGVIGPLQDAYNNARSTAFARMLMEAEAVDADVVTGVKVLDNRLDVGGNVISYSIVGTAMSFPKLRSVLVDRQGRSRPVLTTFSGQELAKIVSSGFIPLGLAAHTSVLFTALSYPTLQAMSYIYSGGGNFEIAEFTQCYYESRNAVMSRVHELARSLGAHGVVGADLKVASRGYSISQMNGENPDSAIYTAEMVATAIAELSLHEPFEKAQLVMSMKR
jgi:uncharacterized protein YbjQ (UPF0145 family)